MQDPLRYTEEELVKELVLLEKHLKQSPYMDENFCLECQEKHLTSIEGLAEEGIGFADNKKKEKMFADVANKANRLKREIKTNPDFAELSREVREIRKSLGGCTICKNNSDNPKQKLLMPLSEIKSLAGFRHIAHHGDEDQYYDLHFADDEYYISDEGVIIWRSSDNFPDLARDKWKQLTGEDLSYKKIEKIKNSPKDLNSSLSKDKNNPIKLQKGGIYMVSKEQAKNIGIINAGAFAGKGIQVLADYIDTKMPATVGLPVAAEWYKRPSTYINVVGGIALQLLALYGIKNDNLKLLVTVAGANMATKAIDIGKEALTPVPTVGARLPGRAPPLRVTPRAPAAVAALAAPGLVTVD